MVVTDLSNSFNPVPKNRSEKIKKVNTIKKKSNKLAKKERNRFSILQEEKECFLCGKRTGVKIDKHEAFGGANRQKSIEWGLVYYLCRDCHKKADVDISTKKYLHAYARGKFIKKYSKEEFLNEFGKNYLKLEIKQTSKG